MRESKFTRGPLADIAPCIHAPWLLRTSIRIYTELRPLIHSTKHIVKSLRCGEMVCYRKYFSLLEVLLATSPRGAPVQTS